MTNLDHTKAANKLISNQLLEEKIAEYKTFYKTHLAGIKNRDEILAKLFPLCKKFQKYKPLSPLYIDPLKVALEVEAEQLIIKNFKPSILQLYRKEIPVKESNNKGLDELSWASFFKSLSNVYESVTEKFQQEYYYRRNFLIYLNNCMADFGLHPGIADRDSKTYTRYNFLLEHDFKLRTKFTEYKILLSAEELQKEFLLPYEKKLPVKINGKLIPFKNFYRIRISSTMLLDDEVELYGKKHNFIWNKVEKEELKFINVCPDETDELLKNPFLVDEDKKVKAEKINFVDPSRIEELKTIKGKKVGLEKLIQLCEELNTNSVHKNVYSLSLLIRAIIDHIPPIFNFRNFADFANQYSDGGKSFKNSMMHLQNSLRNIADHNIHSQARDKEVIPTFTQVDFRQDLDLLLGEAVRKLK